jgi:DNA polymerase III epsilon subunit-like protein
MDAVFIDIETGGLELTHPVIQIAAISVDAAWNELEAFEAKIRFDPKVCDAEALRINHYDPGVWEREARDEKAVALDLQAFMRRHARLSLTSKAGRPYKVARLAGHNITAFDIPRIRALMDRHVSWFAGCWWYPLDTYALALWRYYAQGGPPNYQLQTLATALGVSSEDQAATAHEALADVRTNIRVARALLGQGGDK